MLFREKLGARKENDMTATETPTLNGNKFVKAEHVFIQGVGCFFPTLEIAKRESYSPNGVGYWEETIVFAGKTWFQTGHTNIFD